MNNEEINIKAFLKLIRYAEHGREDDDVYYLLYGGKQKFSDTTQHPNKAIEAWGHTSNAAGAYQILFSTWNEAKQKSIVADFSPDAQDTIARWKLETRKAMAFVKAGELEKAIAVLRNEWTSLPGASQSKMTMTEAKERFAGYVKEYSKS